MCIHTGREGIPLVSYSHFISILHSAPCYASRPHFSCNQFLRANQEVKKSKTARPLPISFSLLLTNLRAD